MGIVCLGVLPTRLARGGVRERIGTGQPRTGRPHHRRTVSTRRREASCWLVRADGTISRMFETEPAAIFVASGRASEHSHVRSRCVDGVVARDSTPGVAVERR
jgi:hypothetical protein